MNKYTELMKLMEKEEPEPADAIVWLQGDKLDRGEKVSQLCVEDGYASNIILSGNNVNTHYADFVSLGTMAHWLIDIVPNLCATGFPRGVFIDRSAANTYEHPLGVLGIAREMGWKRLLLVTSLYHQPRAFLAFLPHLQPDEVIINQPWTGVSFREKQADMKGHRLLYTMEQEADKVDSRNRPLVKKFAEMQVLATVDEGIDYINNRLDFALRGIR